MLKWAGLALALIALAPAAAQEIEGNIVTGAAAGTDLAIGRDIAAMAAECGITLNVRESAGSVENMQAVRDRRLTQFGIVQGDVLEYYQTLQGDDPELRRAVQGIRVAFPLYDAEVHVLARREIADLAGLAGGRVAIGDPDSGTHLTAELVLDLAQVAPAERLELGPEEALEALRAGEIDAMFYVVGAPAELFQAPEIDAAAFHLLPLRDPALTAVYASAEIPAGTYPFVDAPVEVVAVRTVLVTYDFDSGRNAYQAASCRMVSDVSHLILSRFDRLREAGHPKWRAVDFTGIPPGWTVGTCVLQGLAPDYAFTCRRPDGSVVEEGPAGGDPNGLFRQRVCAKIGC
jgi:TRAP transporter TAXI family solute receptor